VPFLALAAGAAVGPVLRRDRLVLLAAGAGLLLVLPWGLGGVRDMFARQAAANEATRWSAVGAATGDAGALDRALDLYRYAVAEGKGSPAAWLGLAAMYDGRGEWQEAEGALLRGRKFWPGHVEIGKQVVALRIRQGRREEALAAAEAVLAQDPGEADTLHNATILLAGLDRTAEARVRSEELIASHPRDPRGYNDLGILLAREGRADEAREVFRRGLAAVPGDPDLAENLARLGKDSR